MNPKTIATKRLLLRPFQANDLGPFCALFRDPGFIRFSGKTSFADQEVAAFLEKHRQWSERGIPAQFSVLLPESAALIGFCGFFHQEVDGVEEIEIGYRLHPDHWNQGLATEAARAVRDHAFRDLEMERVISIIHPENRASRRVAEKNGMRLEKETTFKEFPALVFALSRDEWRRTQA